MKDLNNLQNRQLFIVNGGIISGGSVKVLSDIFGKFGLIESIVFSNDMQNAYISYKDIKSAISAKMELDNAIFENLSKRKIGVMFYQEKKKPNTQIPNASITLDCLASDTLPGLISHSDFLTALEEESILSFISNVPWDDTLKRRVMHYGLAFNYRTLGIGEDAPLIPDIFTPIMKRLVSLGVFPDLPNQLTINEYKPGQGIAAHVDTHSWFDHAIVTISLGGSVTMDFSPIYPPDSYIKSKTFNRIKDAKPCSVYLPPRALVAFTSICRFAYKHGIASRKTDNVSVNGQSEIIPRKMRFSLTFRMVPQMKKKCACEFPWACDTQNPHSLSLPTRI